MIDRKSTVKTSTWRYYKAAVSFYLAENGYGELAEQLKKESNKGTLDSIQNRADTVLRTSSLKQKYITEQQEEKILTLLKAQKKDGHFWAGPLQTFIKAGLLVGLRPSEWPNSAMFIERPPTEGYEGKLPALRVKNGKASNGRSFGEYRTIDLSQLKDVELESIYFAVVLASQRRTPSGVANSYSDYYKALRDKMYSIDTLLFGRTKKNITLYSCRHQFIADLKHANYTLQQIAALVGHGSDATATIHYGKKRNGRAKGNLPLPHQPDVEKIKSHSTTKKETKVIEVAFPG